MTNREAKIIDDRILELAGSLDDDSTSRMDELINLKKKLVEDKEGKSIEAFMKGFRNEKF